MAEGFHQEFLRLYASSKPVPGFIEISCSPLDTFQLTQDMKTAAVSKPEEKQSKPVDLEDLIEDAHDLEMKLQTPDFAKICSPESKSSMNDEQPQNKPETVAEVPEKPAQVDSRPPVQDAPEKEQEKVVEAVSTPHDAQTNVASKPQEKEQSETQTQEENSQSEPESPSDSTTSASTVILQDSSSQQTEDRPQTATWLKQRSTNILTKPASSNAPRRHWNCTLDFKPNMDHVPEHHMPLSPGANWHSHPISPQQVSPPGRFTWMPQSHWSARQNSFDPVYRMGQNHGPQVGWRQLNSSVYSGLQRSQSMNDRPPAVFMRPDRHLSVS